MSDIADRARKIIVEHLGVNAEDASDDAELHDVLGADSLDDVELVMAFEEEFGIDLSDVDADCLATANVGQVIAMLEAAMAG